MNPLFNNGDGGGDGSNQSSTAARYRIPIPGVTTTHAAGDLIQTMAKAFGISADECSPCQQRKQQLNSFLAFVPYDNDGGLG